MHHAASASLIADDLVSTFEAWPTRGRPPTNLSSPSSGTQPWSRSPSAAGIGVLECEELRYPWKQGSDPTPAFSGEATKTETKRQRYGVGTDCACQLIEGDATESELSRRHDSERLCTPTRTWAMSPLGASLEAGRIGARPASVGCGAPAMGDRGAVRGLWAPLCDAQPRPTTQGARGASLLVIVSLPPFARSRSNAGPARHWTSQIPPMREHTAAGWGGHGVLTDNQRSPRAMSAGPILMRRAWSTYYVDSCAPRLEVGDRSRTNWSHSSPQFGAPAPSTRIL